MKANRDLASAEGEAAIAAAKDKAAKIRLQMDAARAERERIDTAKRALAVEMEKADQANQAAK